MKREKEARRRMKTQNPTSVRASMSFPPDLNQTLGALAKYKKVSLAWVIREASEKYVGDQGLNSLQAARRGNHNHQTSNNSRT
jgi:predicted DNA-binding protein